MEANGGWQQRTAKGRMGFREQTEKATYLGTYQRTAGGEGGSAGKAKEKELRRMNELGSPGLNQPYARW